MDNYKIPCREPFDIEYSGVKVKAESVKVALDLERSKIGITLIIPDFTEEKRKIYTGVAYLILDQALGEYDVETKVGYIDVRSSAPAAVKVHSLSDFPHEFDSAQK
ncbi:MAG: hypothetical protein EOO43_10970 [Flavobacterium sp.]|nr:MAG: hypothetical protein EOO43_10970 [Flavobacterium sp.]